jgi:hypothetical protein
MSSPYKQLPTPAQGRWWIRTGTSYYVVDLDAKPSPTIERLPSDLPASDLHRAELRQDGQARPLLTWLEQPTVGQSLRCMVMIRDDGIPTMRTTTAITEIGQLVNDDDHMSWNEITSDYTEGTGDGTSGMDADLRRGRGGNGLGGGS